MKGDQLIERAVMILERYGTLHASMDIGGNYVNYRIHLKIPTWYEVEVLKKVFKGDPSIQKHKFEDWYWMHYQSKAHIRQIIDIGEPRWNYWRETVDVVKLLMARPRGTRSGVSEQEIEIREGLCEQVKVANKGYWKQMGPRIKQEFEEKFGKKLNNDVITTSN